MKKVIATVAPEFRSDAVLYVAWAYAAVLTVMAVGQLFAYEEFLPLLQEYGLPGRLGVFVAGVVVVAEIFALPFLLRMRLSPLLRMVSMACSIAAPLIWLILAAHALLAGVIPANGGMFGTKVDVPVQAQLAVSSVLTVIAVSVVAGVKRKQ